MNVVRPVGRSFLRWARNQEPRACNVLSTSYSAASRSFTKVTLLRACSTLSCSAFQVQRCHYQPTQQADTRPQLQVGRHLRLNGERRMFSASAVLMHEHLTPPKAGEELHITFVDKEGDEHTFTVSKGDNLLDIALDNDLEMEGACGGSCACSTCHVIVEDEELYDKMDEPDDDENDMLDLAFGLTETSRLGCQVKMRPELDGLRVRLPAMTRNLQASDFSKKNERSD